MSGIATAGGARSWLFVPGDSERKMAKACASEADIVLIDLEDAVSEEEKPAARQKVQQFLRDNASEQHRLWVRINPLSSGLALDDLVHIMPAAPGGIMLPKPTGRCDVERLDHYLTAFEAMHDISAGATGVILVATETPHSTLATRDYAGFDRLCAMTWGAEDLATALGASTNRTTSGDYTFTYQFARTACLIGASVAEASAIETMHGDYRDDAGLRDLARAACGEGFGGMIAIHPAQAAIINECFSPSADELAQAHKIVALFAANPGKGAIGHDGVMLDRPHLLRAEAIIARTR